MTPHTVPRVPTARELEPEVERTLTGDWPAVSMADLAALDAPTRPIRMDPALIALLDQIAQRAP